MTRAQPPLEFIPPALNPLVLRGCQALLPLWLRSQAKIDSIEARGCERLAQLYSQFQQGKIRLLLAFRHPSIVDPPCLAYLLWKLVPQAARQKGIFLKSPVHAHFLYDRGIPLWAGDWLGWLASRLGGTSIQRGKLDVMGLRSARQLLADSSFPLAAAPEGATNGHSGIISPLEPGIAQLSFWCAEDLGKANRTEEVLIVPIGIRYRYLTPPWEAIGRLLVQLERDSGLLAAQEQKVTANGELASEALYARLYRLGEHLLSLMEDFYQEFYHQHLPEIPHLETGEALTDKLNGRLAARLQNLLDVALRVAEDYFKIEPKGNFIDRCRRLEQAGWDCIYREELKPSHPLSPVERGLANLVAEEADLRLWHMRLVDSFVAVTGHYVKEKPTAERFAETALLVADLVSRLKGDNNSARPHLGRQRVEMVIGESLSVSQRQADYRANRRQAIANLTQDLQGALESLL